MTPAEENRIVGYLYVVPRDVKNMVDDTWGRGKYSGVALVAVIK